MLISFSHKFLFVHVWKVAGTSIRESLRPFAHDPRSTPANKILRALRLPWTWPTLKSKVFDPHIPARGLRDQLPRGVFQGFFKFGFVRNPWELLISRYHYIVQNPRHPLHTFVKSLGFPAYLEWLAQHDKRQQKDFLVDEHGQLLVNFVGRFERIDADFREICQRLGICAPLKSLNNSRHDDYRTYYDRRAIQLVADSFRDDIERFEYTFDQAARSHDSPPATRQAA
jgi:sulfotransferase famil protein